MTDEIVTKKRFAEIAEVTPGCLSQWLAAGKVHGNAIVGVGHRARIRVSVAMEQLRRNLDPVYHLGANGRANVDGNSATASPTVEQSIKAERLRQLEIGNRVAQLDAGIRAGRYMLVDEAKTEMGRDLGRLLATFEASFGEFAAAIVAAKPKNAREAQRVLRQVWRGARERQAKAIGTEVMAAPAMFDDEDDHAAGERRADRA